MEERKFPNGMLFGIFGAVLTLIGDLLIGANPSSDITTGSQMVDMFIDAAENSELRMAVGGMVLGIHTAVRCAVCRGNEAYR